MRGGTVVDGASPSAAALRDRRKAAAELSGGISDESIYGMFVKTIEHLGLTGSCLDFGAGRGILSRRLESLGRFSRITAADIVSAPAQLPPNIRWLTLDLNEDLRNLHESFDVIVASEVIEHLENPRTVMRSWYDLLRPSGWMLLSTPNNESWRSIAALVFRGHFASFGDSSYPAHITALLRKDVERIAREVGFASPSIVYSDFGLIPKITTLTWQALSSRMFRGLRFSDHWMAVMQKPTLCD